jgi:hypothetical protein
MILLIWYTKSSQIYKDRRRMVARDCKEKGVGEPFFNGHRVSVL